MNRFAMAVGLGAALLLLGGQADAQWRYTDDQATGYGTDGYGAFGGIMIR
jgi:hypothetical protein